MECVGRPKNILSGYFVFCYEGRSVEQRPMMVPIWWTPVPPPLSAPPLHVGGRTT